MHWYNQVAIALSCFTVATMLVVTLVTWSCLSWIQRLYRLTLATMLIYSVFVRSFIFDPMKDIEPPWYSTGFDVFFTILSMLILLSTFRKYRVEGD